MTDESADYVQHHDSHEVNEGVQHEKMSSLNLNFADVEYSDKDDLITFRTGDASFSIRSKRIKTEDLAQLVTRFVAILKHRKAILPSVSFEPRDPPNLLTVPRELRDRIYRFCDFPDEVRSRHIFSIWQDLPDDPSDYWRAEQYSIDGVRIPKRTRVQQLHAKLPGAPMKFPTLRLVCRQLHQEIVIERLHDKNLNLGIDITRDDKTPADEYWEAVFPKCIVSLVSSVNLELRCTMTQWVTIQEALCGTLRRRFPQPKIRIRLAIMYPHETEKSFIGNLPHFCQDRALGFREAWYRAYVGDQNERFEGIKKVECVSMLQVLYMAFKTKLGVAYILEPGDAGHVVVFEKIKGSWKETRGDSVTSGPASRYFEVTNNHGRLQLCVLSGETWVG